MNRFILSMYLLLLAGTISYSQVTNTLYMSREFENAYLNKTRLLTGMPSEQSWINNTSYIINAKIDTENEKLLGTVIITYQNNSTDTLKFLALKLKQNVFKKGANRAYQISKDQVSDGMKINQLKIKHKEVELNSPRRIIERGTMFGVRLNADEFIAPGTSIQLTIEWEYTIPVQAFRTGKSGKSSYFIGYWFPQVSVYDDIFSWDFNSYTGLHETYNDHSEFEVELTIPGEYMIWATGDLLNPAEVYTKKTIKKIKQSKNSNEVVSIIKQEDLINGDILLEKNSLVWKFKASKVPDFAFALSSNYLWDACMAKTNEETNDRTWVNVTYPENASLYHLGAEIAQRSVEYFSTTFPGIPFPYNKHTSVYGEYGLGMEFPMMANDGGVRNDTSLLVDVISHEIAHTYFPFYVNTNEKLYPWMDEGWVSIMGDRVVELYGFDTPDVFKRMFARTWNTVNDLPLMVTGEHLGAKGMTHYYYVRSRFSNEFLLELFEDKGIENPLKPYMESWKSKHPYPYDFFFYMDNLMGESLEWFWIPWYFEFRSPDLEIGSVQQLEKEAIIQIKNPGKMPVPIYLIVEFLDGTKQKIKKSAWIWKENINEYSLRLTLKNTITSIQLGNTHIPDVKPGNNYYTK